MKNITCDIIKDLIPSYLDEILTDDTNELVKEHLAVCPECVQALKDERKRRAEGLHEEQERGEVFSQKLLERRKFVTGLIVGFFLTVIVVAVRLLLGMLLNGIVYGF
ncbi:MAG: zf-HC2 domain-containing protein [Lachnospiraceae bacterium]|nr:zf-HC2 domain-containing protein [Lachnospiraceae bacterium]